MMNFNFNELPEDKKEVYQNAKLEDITKNIYAFLYN